MSSKVTLVVKNLPANAGDARDTSLIPGLGRFPGEKKMATHCLAGYSPRGRKKSWTNLYSIM